MNKEETVKLLAESKPETIAREIVMEKCIKDENLINILERYGDNQNILSDENISNVLFSAIYAKLSSYISIERLSDEYSELFSNITTELLSDIPTKHILDIDKYWTLMAVKACR